MSIQIDASALLLYGYDLGAGQRQWAGLVASSHLWREALIAAAGWHEPKPEPGTGRYLQSSLSRTDAVRLINDVRLVEYGSFDQHLAIGVAGQPTWPEASFAKPVSLAVPDNAMDALRVGFKALELEPPDTLPTWLLTCSLISGPTE